MASQGISAFVGRGVFAVLATVGVLVACSGGGGNAGNTGTTAGAFSFTASVDGAVPAGAKTVVIWSVSSGSPDYAYEFGSGSSQGTQVFVSFSANLPPEALNDGKLGVGSIALVNAGADLPAGKLTGSLDVVSFVDLEHAIIFRNTSEVVLRNGWDKDFPQGFACGKCVRHDSGFDSFEVADCGSLKLVPYSKQSKSCNWT